MGFPWEKGSNVPPDQPVQLVSLHTRTIAELPADHFFLARSPASVENNSDTDSDDDDKTVRPGHFRSRSATTLKASPGDDVFGSSHPTKTPSPIRNPIAERIVSTMASCDKLLHSGEYQPRADRGNEITPANAQGQLPPNAAVFCAKCVLSS